MSAVLAEECPEPPLTLLDDLDVDAPSATPQRIEFIKCQTAHCRSNLGVRQPRGRVWWYVPVDHNYVTGETRVECPYCKSVRVWTPGKGTPRS